ncbi:MAG: 50S ribosomal protein L29 [Patescibacteria group bacterium]
MDDVKTQSTEKLLAAVTEKREALRVFRFGGAGSRTRNVREGRNLRREIAQILTEIKSRGLPVGRPGIAKEQKKA